METADAEVTVRIVVPDTVPEVAVMIALPFASVLAKPDVGDVLLTVATVVSEEFQATLLVKFWVLLSLYVPTAMNCCFRPGGNIRSCRCDVN